MGRGGERRRSGGGGGEGASVTNEYSGSMVCCPFFSVWSNLEKSLLLALITGNLSDQIFYETGSIEVESWLQ